jgi:DNA repair protein RecN (Recombination protein N)
VLRELHVRNLAVLAEASVLFGEGFNILSGETGAGKSIVVDSLFLLAGARANADLIRSGAEALTVSGIFEPQGDGWRAVLEAAGLEAAGDELLIRREVARSGRARVFVNDQPTTLRLLADLAPHLLRIHGQSDQLDLMATDLQRLWLDKSGGADAERALAAVAAAFDLYDKLADRLAHLTGDDRARRERIDLLRFHAEEIDGAHLKAAEEDELRQEREVLRHAEAIARALGTAAAHLLEEEGAAAERLGKSRALLAEIEAWEPQAAAWGAELEELRIRAAELGRALEGRLDEVEADPGRLDAVEERLAQLERIFRKHGATSAAVLARRAEIEAELAELSGDDDNRAELAEKAAQALSVYREAALALSAGRAAWGEALARAIEGELGDLGLGRAKLTVALERRRRADSPLVVGGEGGEAIDFGRTGVDQVVFLFAPNPGEEPRPLARIASGGELSRLYLALQLAARGEGERARPTLVFDEVDTGISGAEAAALGKKLRRLAQGGQILAVTHLPQVASQADRHFKVRKRVEGERTHVSVDPLAAEPRVEEVARMLAGDRLTELSLSHAREMIEGEAAARSAAKGGRRR